MILDGQQQTRRMLLRLKGIESGRSLIGPATVQLHLTDLCNLTCQYCFYYGPGSTLKPTGKNHLPYELIEKLSADLTDLQVDNITLSGIGDPTLHPRFYEILEHLERSFSVTIYSNGTFPVERCRDILRADRIVINLGESDRESYRLLQGRDLFMRVIKNIRELARLKPKYNPNFIIEVVVVVTKLNEKTQMRTENLVRKLGADKVQRKRAEVTAHTHQILTQDYEEKDVIEGAWPPCYHGWFFSSIKLNGDVNVCCFMQRVTIGNVYTTSFKEIWASEAYTRARKQALTGDTFKNFHECINCNAAWRNKEIGAQLEIYKRSHKS